MKKIFIFSITLLLIIGGFLVVVGGEPKDREKINGGEEELQQIQSHFEVIIDDYDDNVTVGDNITVEFTVENIGGAEGTQDIVFSVNGDILATKGSVTLAPGQSYDGESIWETKAEGDYNLTVASEDDGETVTVTVEGEEGEEIGTNMMIGMIAIIAMVAVALIAIVRRKKRSSAQQSSQHKQESPSSQIESYQQKPSQQQQSSPEAPIEEITTPKQKLQELQEMKEEGLINEEEFERKKGEILDNY